MQEYSNEAIVLDKENNGDLDTRISLFTPNFGKLVAKAKSGRKITSKLSGHLEPGNLIQVRLVEKSGLQIVDALKERKLKVSLADLYLLKKILAEAEPERIIWRMLKEGAFRWSLVLKILGWDPVGASCAVCGQKPLCFSLKDQDFFCQKCALKLPKDELIYF